MRPRTDSGSRMRSHSSPSVRDRTIDTAVHERMRVDGHSACICMQACVRACVRACVCACVRAYLVHVCVRVSSCMRARARPGEWRALMCIKSSIQRPKPWLPAPTTVAEAQNLRATSRFPSRTQCVQPGGTRHEQADSCVHWAVQGSPRGTHYVDVRTHLCGGSGAGATPRGGRGGRAGPSLGQDEVPTKKLQIL